MIAALSPWGAQIIGEARNSPSAVLEGLVVDNGIATSGYQMFACVCFCSNIVFSLFTSVHLTEKSKVHWWPWSSRSWPFPAWMIAAWSLWQQPWLAWMEELSGRGESISHHQTPNPTSPLQPKTFNVKIAFPTLPLTLSLCFACCCYLNTREKFNKHIMNGDLI